MSTKAMSRKNIQILSVSAVMVALATILSFLKVWDMPYGGSITVFSMVPLAFISYRYGIKWGVFSAFVFSIIQMLFGISQLGNDLWVVIGSCILDYIAAYTVIGLSGMFRNKIKTPALSITAGFLVATLIRYAIHVISGYIFFRSYAEWYFGQEGFTLGATILEHVSGNALSVLYTFLYNTLYLLPDTIVAVVGLVAIALFAKQYILPQQTKSAVVADETK